MELRLRQRKTQGAAQGRQDGSLPSLPLLSQPSGPGGREGVMKMSGEQFSAQGNPTATTTTTTTTRVKVSYS